eukprot:256775-Chlamydomonas_euryale.AAC.2
MAAEEQPTAGQAAGGGGRKGIGEGLCGRLIRSSAAMGQRWPAEMLACARPARHVTWPPRARGCGHYDDDIFLAGGIIMLTSIS